MSKIIIIPLAVSLLGFSLYFTYENNIETEVVATQEASIDINTNLKIYTPKEYNGDKGREPEQSVAAPLTIDLEISEIASNIFALNLPADIDSLSFEELKIVEQDVSFHFNEGGLMYEINNAEQNKGDVKEISKLLDYVTRVRIKLLEEGNVAVEAQHKQLMNDIVNGTITQPQPLSDEIKRSIEEHALEEYQKKMDDVKLKRERVLEEQEKDDQLLNLTLN